MSRDHKEIYKKLCQLNYGKENGEAPVVSNNNNKLKEYEISEAILSDLDRIKKAIDDYNNDINDDNKLHLGVISSGTHSIDYWKYYKNNDTGTWNGFEDIKSDWNDTPIMFVYECPAANLASSFWGSKNSYFYKKDKENYKNNNPNALKSFPILDFKELLCKDLWHLDTIEHYPDLQDKGFKNLKYFEDIKMYGTFVLSLIQNFKLKNLYTTNIFRYEIFKAEKKNNGIKETALNLPSIKSNLKGLYCDGYLPEVFKKELEILSPEIIFASSNPFHMINNHYESENKKPLIVQVPHPAHPQITNSTRFIWNAMATIAALDSDSDITKTALQRYKELLEKRLENN